MLLDFEKHVAEHDFRLSSVQTQRFFYRTLFRFSFMTLPSSGRFGKIWCALLVDSLKSSMLLWRIH